MILLDFIINTLPVNVAKKISNIFFGQLEYCFLVHARDYRDLYKKFPLLKYFPIFFTKFLSRVLFPIRVGFIYINNKNISNIKGVFVGSPMDAQDMLNNRELAERKIIRAAKFAEKLGVNYIGLGALNASLTKNGLSLKDSVNCLVTTGHALTAWIVSQNAIAIQKIAGKKLTIAIVGAGGSIGSSCFNVLEEYFSNFILIDKDLDRLKDKINLKNERIEKYSNKLDDIYDADIVITATNAPYSIINNSNQLSEGTVVIDDSQPLNASPNVNSEKRKTLVIEGGVCHLDSLYYKLDLNLLDKGDMFSCMGELVALSVSNSDLVTIGDATIGQVEKISKLASAIDIKRARFRSFGKLISEEYIKGLF